MEQMKSMPSCDVTRTKDFEELLHRFENKTIDIKNLVSGLEYFANRFSAFELIEEPNEAEPLSPANLFDALNEILLKIDYYRSRLDAVVNHLDSKL